LEGNSRTSKLAATSSNVTAKADTENAYASGGKVPETDPRHMKVGGNPRPVSDAQQLIDNMLSGQKPYNSAVALYTERECEVRRKASI
jgi:hypothetical protein